MKIMVTMFWERKEICLIEFLHQGEIITHGQYETIKKLHETIQNKRNEIITKGGCLFQNYAQPHRILVSMLLSMPFG